MAELTLVLVTPEKTLFDRPVDSVQVPMFDGSAGIYPGRAPLVGRLGVGALTFRSGTESESWFIDGGFIQIRGSRVSVLTNYARQPSAISKSEVKRELEELSGTRPAEDEEFAVLERRLLRARRMAGLAQAE